MEEGTASGYSRVAMREMDIHRERVILDRGSHLTLMGNMVTLSGMSMLYHTQRLSVF